MSSFPLCCIREKASGGCAHDTTALRKSNTKTRHKGVYTYVLLSDDGFQDKTFFFEYFLLLATSLPRSCMAEILHHTHTHTPLIFYPLDLLRIIKKDGQTARQVDIQTDTWLDAQTERSLSQLSTQIDRQIDSKTGRFTDIWTEKTQTDKQIHG